MGETIALGFDPDASGAAPRPEPPQVFVRTFVVPPGAPWVQGRAATLEVRHGAPLPLADLMHRVRRREGWRPGQAGRFAAFYIRRADYSMPFETIVDVDGDAFRIAFGANAQDFQRLRRLALAGLAAAVIAGLVASGGVAALNARADASGRLDTLSRQIDARLRQGRQIAAQADVMQALARAQGHTALSTQVLDDLDWLAHARTADAQILAVHWDHGLMVVESRGEASPVSASGREVVRAPRPARPGVWLWGVRQPASAPTPLAATLQP